MEACPSCPVRADVQVSRSIFTKLTRAKPLRAWQDADKRAPEQPVNQDCHAPRGTPWRGRGATMFTARTDTNQLRSSQYGRNGQEPRSPEQIGELTSVKCFAAHDHDAKNTLSRRTAECPGHPVFGRCRWPRWTSISLSRNIDYLPNSPVPLLQGSTSGTLQLPR